MADRDNLWLVESPTTMMAGEVIAYSVDWLGAAKVESPLVTVYRDGEEVTSAVMVLGDSHVVSGNVVTLKKITAGATHGGSNYVVVVKCQVDNNTEMRKLLIRVVKAEAEG